MVTYLYWAVVIALVVLALWFIGGKLNRWAHAFIAVAVVLVVGWAAYYFHFQQVFVKRWGGFMNISVPDGQYHIHATWKDDNLWIENYDPAENICYFNEYSRGNILQGKVIIKNCKPLSAPPPQPE